MPIFGGQPDVLKLQEKMDIKGLIKALSYKKDPKIRREAAFYLSQTKDARAVNPLIEAFKDQDPNVRGSAMRAVGLIGDARAVEPLLKALQDTVVSVRNNAINGLEYVGDHRAIEPLIACLQDHHEIIRTSAIHALGGIGNGIAVQSLALALEDKILGVREAAAINLAKIGGPHVVEPLVRALKDKEPQVRSSAARWLSAIGPEGVEKLGRAIKDKDKFVRRQVVKALAEIGDPRGIDALILALKDKDLDVRKAAVEALAKIGEGGAAHALVSTLKNKDQDLRISAAETLEQLGWNPDNSADGARYWITKKEWDKCLMSGNLAIIPLSDALKSGTKEFRIGAIKTLGQNGDERVIKPIIAALSDRVKDVQETAATVLDNLNWKPDGGETEAWYWIAKSKIEKCEGLGASAVGPLLVSLKEGEQKWNHRIGDTLIKIGPPTIKRLLTAPPKTKDSSIQVAIQRVLGNIGDKRAVTPLIDTLLNDPQISVREAAASALGILDDERAVKPLCTTLKGKFPFDRQVSAQALYKLGWRPDLDETGAWYWIARENLKKCIPIGSKAIIPLIDVLSEGDSSMRLTASELLVELFSSDDLNEKHKKIILRQQKLITSQHTDNTSHYDEPNRCIDSHSDTRHEDKGVSNFPL